MQETDDAPPEVTFIDLGWYFGVGLAALSPRSNLGAQLERLQYGLAGCRGSHRVDYSLADEVIDAVSRMRPIERRLARMSEESRYVLWAMFGDPNDCQPRVEWTFMVKSAGSTALPLGLLLLAARTLGLSESTLLRWAQASTASERTDAAAGMVRVRDEARRLRASAVQEWRAAGLAPGEAPPLPLPLVLPSERRAAKRAERKAPTAAASRILERLRQAPA